MSRWTRSGYAEPGLFPGANRCRFRLVCVRDDGLVVQTLGQQTDGGGRIGPIHQGRHFATFVGRPGEVAQIAVYDTHEAAALGHQTTLDVWEDMDE